MDTELRASKRQAACNSGHATKANFITRFPLIARALEALPDEANLEKFLKESPQSETAADAQRFVLSERAVNYLKNCWRALRDLNPRPSDP